MARKQHAYAVRLQIAPQLRILEEVFGEVHVEAVHQDEPGIRAGPNRGAIDRPDKALRPVKPLSPGNKEVRFRFCLPARVMDRSGLTIRRDRHLEPGILCGEIPCAREVPRRRDLGTRGCNQHLHPLHPLTGVVRGQRDGAACPAAAEGDQKGRRPRWKTADGVCRPASQVERVCGASVSTRGLGAVRV